MVFCKMSPGGIPLFRRCFKVFCAVFIIGKGRMLFAKRIKLPFVDWYLIKGTELKNVEKEVQELIRKNKISNKVTSIVLKKVATGQI